MSKRLISTERAASEKPNKTATSNFEHFDSDLGNQSKEKRGDSCQTGGENKSGPGNHYHYGNRNQGEFRESRSGGDGNDEDENKKHERLREHAVDTNAKILVDRSRPADKFKSVHHPKIQNAATEHKITIRTNDVNDEFKLGHEDAKQQDYYDEYISSSETQLSSLSYQELIPDDDPQLSRADLPTTHKESKSETNAKIPIFSHPNHDLINVSSTNHMLTLEQEPRLLSPSKENDDPREGTSTSKLNQDVKIYEIPKFREEVAFSTLHQKNITGRTYLEGKEGQNPFQYFRRNVRVKPETGNKGRYMNASIKTDDEECIASRDHPHDKKSDHRHALISSKTIPISNPQTFAEKEVESANIFQVPDNSTTVKVNPNFNENPKLHRIYSDYSPPPLLIKNSLAQNYEEDLVINGCSGNTQSAATSQDNLKQLMPKNSLNPKDVPNELNRTEHLENDSTRTMPLSDGTIHNNILKNEFNKNDDDNSKGMQNQFQISANEEPVGVNERLTNSIKRDDNSRHSRNNLGKTQQRKEENTRTLSNNLEKLHKEDYIQRGDPKMEDPQIEGPQLSEIEKRKEKTTHIGGVGRPAGYQSLRSSTPKRNENFKNPHDQTLHSSNQANRSQNEQFISSRQHFDITASKANEPRKQIPPLKEDYEGEKMENLRFKQYEPKSRNSFKEDQNSPNKTDLAALLSLLPDSPIREDFSLKKTDQATNSGDNRFDGGSLSDIEKSRWWEVQLSDEWTNSTNPFSNIDNRTRIPSNQSFLPQLNMTAERNTELISTSSVNSSTVKSQRGPDSYRKYTSKYDKIMQNQYLTPNFRALHQRSNSVATATVNNSMFSMFDESAVSTKLPKLPRSNFVRYFQ